MSNINFSNPWYFLALIPLSLFVIVPFFISIKKGGFNWHNITSLCLHAAMVLLVVSAMSGTKVEKSVTSTEMIVLADVSHSTRTSYDKIDSYITELSDKSGQSISLEVVAFGEDQQVISSFNESPKSIKNNTVEKSSSNIADALDFCSTKFDDGFEKRIVLLSDGMETDGDALNKVKILQNEGIRIDCIYLDDVSSDLEVQVNNVSFSESTFQNRDEKAKVEIESNYASTLKVALYEGNIQYLSKDVTAKVGTTTVEFPLITSRSGVESYHVTITADWDTDTSNNTYYFTQVVKEEPRVLIVAGSDGAINAPKELYKNYKDVKTYLQSDIPTSLEFLCNYDEIVFSDVVVRSMPHCDTFVENLQTAVVTYGKSLMVYGGTVAADDSSEIGLYNKMLPVNFDIRSSQTALVIVVDASMSMSQNNRLAMAKKGAIQCLSLLDDDDYISVIQFNGSVKVVVPLTRVIDRDSIESKINSISQSQGTRMASGLTEAYNQLKGLNFDVKQCMLLSDGVPTDSGQKEIIEQMLAENITTSVINIQSSEGATLLKSLAEAGNGNYYYISSTNDLPDIMMNEANNDIGVAYVEQECTTNIKLANDMTVADVASLPVINGVNYTVPKYTANTVLTVDVITGDGVKKETPLFAYWEYGLGKVGIFTSDISTNWASSWLSDENALSFLDNVTDMLKPQYRWEEANTVEFINNGDTATLNVTPNQASRSMKYSVEVTSPSNKVEKYTMTISGDHFTTTFAVDESGEYKFSINLETDDYITTNTYYKCFSYSSEYDDFASGNEYLLYQMAGDTGVLSDDITTFAENEIKYETSTTELALPMLIAALALFIVDLIIRKLKWSDILYIFKSTVKEN